MKKYQFWVLALVICSLLVIPMGDVDVSVEGVSKSVFRIGFAGRVYAAAPDYEVDGTADDVQVQQALDDLPSTGGKIILYAGTYDFTATVSRAINNVTLEGSGRATYFAYNDSTALFSAGSQSGWTFRDFATDSGGITLSSASDYKLENVLIGVDDYNYVREVAFVVAAGDSTNETKSQADYVCDGYGGTGDEFWINTALAAANGGIVQLVVGTYYLSSTRISITDGILRGQGEGTVLQVEATSGGITIDPSASYNRGIGLRDVRLRTITSGYNDNAVYIVADNEMLSGVNGLVENVFIEGHGSEKQGTGIYIYANASTGNAAVDACSFRNVQIWYYSYGIRMYAQESGGNSGWINGNWFDNIYIYASEYMVYNEGKANLGAVSGNHWSNVELQPSNTYTIDGINLYDGARYNQFDSVFAWDWTLASGEAVIVGINSSQNRITGYLANSIVDNSTASRILDMGGGGESFGASNITRIRSIYLDEQADAGPDVAGDGQIWVNTAEPNELWFTDDTGEDFQLGTGASANGTRSVSITVAASDAGGNWTSQSDFTCDGTDDQIDIMSAVAALPATGGVVALSEGTFHIDGDIDVAADNITIEGQGRGTVIRLVDGHDASVFLIDFAATADRFRVANLVLDGNKANQGGGSGTGVYTNGATDGRIENIETKDMYSTNNGIMLLNADRAVVTGCEIHDGGGKGISNGGSEYTIVSDNVIYRNGSWGLYYYSNPDHSIISNNILHSNGVNADNTYPQIHLTVGSDMIITGNVVREGAEANNPSYAIDTGAGFNRALIIGNDFYDSGQSGDLLDGSATTLERDNKADGGGWISSAADGEGVRSASLTIAASDAGGNWTLQADFVCDGTDDHVQIESAIAALPSAGGTVLLSEGLFLVDDEINIDATNVTIQGQGRGTKIKLATANDGSIQMIDFSASGSYGVVRDLTVDGNKSGQGGGQQMGIQTQSSSDFLLVENVYVENTNHHSIWLGGSYATVVDCFIIGPLNDAIQLSGSNNLVYNCRIRDSTANGIDLLSSANYNRIIGNYVYNNNEHGIACLGDSNLISNNQVYNNGKDSDLTYQGIYVDTGDDNTLEGNVVRLGTSGARHQYGVLVNSSAATNTTIHGNNLFDSGGTGALSDSGTNTREADNIDNDGTWISSAGADGEGVRSPSLTVAASNAGGNWTDQADFVCDGTDDEVQVESALAALPVSGGRVVLSEGTFTISSQIDIGVNNVTLQGQGAGTVIRLEAGNDSTLNLIDVSGTGDYAVIRDLTIDGNRAAQSTGTQIAIDINSGAFYTLVDSVNVMGMRSQGVLIGSDYVTLRGSTISDTGGSALQLGGSYCLIEGNEIHDSDTNGIEGAAGAYSRIIGNQIYDCGHDGMTMNSSHGLIEANYIRENSKTTNDTYMGIQIGTGDYNTITGNTIRRGSSGNRHAYGVDVNAAGALNTTIHGNDLYDSGISGDINDSGTATLERNNVANAGGWISTAGGDGEGGRSSSLIVAASNAGGNWTSQSDFVCDGTDDHIQIESAIAALPATGGTILLSEGTFTIDDEINIGVDNVTLQGQGISTVIALEDANNGTLQMIDISSSGDSATIRDLRIDVNRGGQSSGTQDGINIADAANYVTIDNVAVGGARGDGIKVIGAYNSIVNSEVTWCNDDNIHIGGDWNLLEGSGSYNATNMGLHLSSNAGFNRVVNNQFSENGRHGMYIIGSNNLLANNYIYNNSKTTDQAYQGIYVDTGSMNTLTGNMVRRGPSGNRHEYGVLINSAGAVGTHIYGNDLYDSGSTGDISDSGSNTRERDNIANDGTWYSSAADGEGVRSSSLTVAANDAGGNWTSQSDFVCDGTDDDIQINSAIAALPSGGGTVLLSEGIFTVSSSILVTNNTALVGQGRSTIIRLVDGHDTSIDLIANSDDTGGNEGIRIADLRINSNSQGQTSGTIQGIHFDYADYSTIENVYAENARVGANIYVEYGDHNLITNCWATNATTSGSGIYLLFTTYTVLANSFIWDNNDWGIESSNMDDSLITSCAIWDNFSTGVEMFGDRSGIVDSLIYSNSSDGIYFDAADGSWATGNSVYDNWLRGVNVNNSYNTTLESNTIIGNGQQADDTYANIQISASDYTLISDNTIRRGSGANQSKEGILISAVTSAETVIHGNDLYTSGKTTDISDSGTDTRERNNIANAGGWYSSAADGEGVRSSSITVAASDAGGNWTSQADFVCDGVDDNLDIRSAVDALPSMGGAIVLSEGTFSIGGEIWFTAANVTFQGQGGGTVLRLEDSHDATTQVFDLGAGCDGVAFKDFVIDGNRANQSSGSTSGIDLSGVSNVLIDNVEIKNIYGSAESLELTNCNYAVVTDSCEVHDGDSMLLYVNGGSNIWIGGRYYGGETYGAWIGPTSNITLSADFHSNSLSSNNGFPHIRNDSGTDVLIMGSRARVGGEANKASYALDIQASATRTTIIGNDFLSSGVSGDILDAGTGTLERDNVANAGGWISSAADGEGVRSSSLTVAASDAGGNWTAQADFTCDGTSDEVQIESAIAALPATGGRVTLSEGTFTLGGEINIAVDNVTLEGQGVGTIITLVDGHDTSMSLIDLADGGDYAVIQNLQVNGNAGNQAAGTIYGVGLDDGCDYVLIESVLITEAKSGAIYIGGGYTMVKGCRLYSNPSNGLNLVSTTNNILIEGCYVESSTGVGILLNGGESVTVTGCSIGESGLHGIGLYSYNSTVTKNFIYNSSRTTDTSYAGIRANNGDNNVIEGNTIRMALSGNRPDYGIEITSSADRTKVFGNDLYASAVTAGYIDGGTNTRERDNIDNDGDWITGSYFYRTLVWYIDGDVATGDQQGPTIYIDQACTIVDVEMYAETAPTGAEIEIDIRDDGATIFTVIAEIDAAANRDDNNHTFSATSIAADSQLVLDIDKVGSGTVGADLTVMLEVKCLIGD